MKYRIPLYLAIAAIILYSFGKCEGAAGRENSSIIAQAQQALASGKAYRARQTFLSEIARSNMALYREAQHVAQVRGALIAQLDTALSNASTVRDSVPILVRQNLELRGQITDLVNANVLLERARLADSTRADHAEARVADLETNLARTLTVAECHIAGVSFLPRCPSRTMSFILGAGVATVGVLLVRH